MNDDSVVWMDFDFVWVVVLKGFYVVMDVVEYEDGVRLYLRKEECRKMV